PSLPTREIAAEKLRSARAHGARRGQELVDELRERRLGERYRGDRVGIPLDDPYALAGGDPGERRAVVRAERERWHPAEIGEDEMPVAGDQRGQLDAMEVRERVRLERSGDRLDPRQPGMEGIGGHSRLLSIVLLCNTIVSCPD